MHLLWNADNAKCPKGCFRPVGLAVDGPDRVFMTSDATGEVFVVTGAQRKADCKRSNAKSTRNAIRELV